MHMLQYFNHLIFPNPLKISTYSIEHSSLMNPISPHETIFMQKSLHHCSAFTSREKNSSQLAHSTAARREEIFGQQICSKYKLLLIMFGMKLFWEVLTFFSAGLVTNRETTASQWKTLERGLHCLGPMRFPFLSSPQILSVLLRELFDSCTLY